MSQRRDTRLAYTVPFGVPIAPKVDKGRRRVYTDYCVNDGGDGIRDGTNCVRTITRFGTGGPDGAACGGERRRSTGRGPVPDPIRARCSDEDGRQRSTLCRGGGKRPGWRLGGKKAALQSHRGGTTGLMGPRAGVDFISRPERLVRAITPVGSTGSVGTTHFTLRRSRQHRYHLRQTPIPVREPCGNAVRT